MDEDLLRRLIEATADIERRAEELAQTAKDASKAAQALQRRTEGTEQ